MDILLLKLGYGAELLFGPDGGLVLHYSLEFLPEPLLLSPMPIHVKDEQSYETEYHDDEISYIKAGIRELHLEHR